MLRAIWIVCCLLVMVNLLVVVVLTGGAMHPPRIRRPEDVALPAHNIEQFTGSTASVVGITAADGTVLKAWWFLPRGGATRAVIVCHGIGDSAMGGIGFAPLFLRDCYAVLVPDSRGHGASGGFVTFGVRESADIVQWLQWVKQQGPSAVYGLGESLGGSILLQSLPRGADFRAVVVESAYASFREVADYRVGKVIGPFFAPVLVRQCMLYARLRYHINLWDANSALAIVHTTVPILLIHGLADNETRPSQSQQIAKANPAIRLWLVPRAVHTGAYNAAPAEFESRVLAWFTR